MSKRLLLLASLLAASCLQAMAQTKPADDFMRSMGKMYVVVAVIVTVFLGIIVFLVYLDRKLTKFENQTKQND